MAGRDVAKKSKLEIARHRFRWLRMDTDEPDGFRKGPAPELKEDGREGSGFCHKRAQRSTKSMSGSGLDTIRVGSSCGLESVRFGLEIFCFLDFGLEAIS